MKKVWPTHCVFCEDIRHEVGGKLSLMGIFIGGDMTFSLPSAAQHIPVSIPKLCVVVYLIADVGDTPNSLNIKVFAPGSADPIAGYEVDEVPHPPVREGSTKAILTSFMEIPNVVFTSPGDLNVMMTVDGEETRIGRLVVSFSEANQKPSSIS